MAKVLRCSDVMCGCDCNAVLDGKDVAEVMVNAEEHAKTAHGMMTVPPELVSRVQMAIKDE